MSEDITLLDRLRAATGPHRELDAAIFEWLHGDFLKKYQYQRTNDGWSAGKPFATIPTPRYTASIDACIAEVGEKLPDNVITSITEVRVKGGRQCIGIITFVAGAATFKENAPTPALALLTAFVAAMSATEKLNA